MSRRIDSLAHAGFLRVEEMSDREFEAVRQLIYSRTGIALGPAKKALVISRLAGRLRALGIRSVGSYVELASRDAAERQCMIDALTTNETQFFREPAHWRLFTQQIIPVWRAEAESGARPRRTRVWSAGCSTGEEPFSIAMVLLAGLPPEDGWTHEVLATDISERALTHAATATWPVERQRHIPPHLLERFMLRGVQSRHGLIRAAPEVRAIVSFANVNLNEPHSYPRGLVDAVFCRNVLIYFDAESRRRAIDHLTARLAPRGYFFLGHAESLSGTTTMRSLGPNAYVRRD
jgi:chemotaxis protein methyltransferase CheR